MSLATNYLHVMTEEEADASRRKLIGKMIQNINQLDELSRYGFYGKNMSINDPHHLQKMLNGQAANKVLNRVHEELEDWLNHLTI